MTQHQQSITTQSLHKCSVFKNGAGISSKNQFQYNTNRQDRIRTAIILCKGYPARRFDSIYVATLNSRRNKCPNIRILIHSLALSLRLFLSLSRSLFENHFPFTNQYKRHSLVIVSRVSHIPHKPRYFYTPIYIYCNYKQFLSLSFLQKKKTILKWQFTEKHTIYHIGNHFILTNILTTDVPRTPPVSFQFKYVKNMP